MSQITINEKIDEIRNTIFISDILEYFGYDINANNKALCCWHDEKTPSMHVYDGHVYCYGCGKRGDAIELVRKLRKCRFHQAVIFICDQFLSDAPTADGLKPERRVRPELDSTANEAQVFALQSTLNSLNQYTQNYISENKKLPQKIQEYFKRRGFDIDFLITHNFFEENVLFLNDPKEFSFFLKQELHKNGHDWQKTALFAKDGDTVWLDNDSYCVLIPMTAITWDTENNPKLLVSAFRIRNIHLLQNLFPTQEAVFTRSCNNIEHTPGLMGLNFAYKKHPAAVLDKCRGLTVVWVEGGTDFIAAYELIHKFHCLGENLCDKIVILSAGGVTSCANRNLLGLVQNCDSLVVALDNDSAGEEGFLKIQKVAKELGIQTVKQWTGYEDYKDLNDYLVALKIEQTQGQ